MTNWDSLNTPLDRQTDRRTPDGTLRLALNTARVIIENYLVKSVVKT